MLVSNEEGPETQRGPETGQKSPCCDVQKWVTPADLVCTTLPSRKGPCMRTSLASRFYKTEGPQASGCLDACLLG